MLKLISIIATAFSLSGSLFADAVSVEELRAIQQKIVAHDSLSVEFLQTRTIPTRKNPSKSQGEAFLAVPGKFHWHIKKPAENIFIFDGKNLFDVNPVEKTASPFKTGQSSSQELSRIVDYVLNFNKLLEKYRVVKAEQSKGKIQITLIPRTPEDIAEVNIEYDSAKQFVSTLVLTYSNKYATRLDFSRPRFGKVPAEMFAVPADVKTRNI